MDERLHSFAGSGDGVFAVNAQQKIIFWNDALAGVIGMAASDAVGRPCWEVMRGISPAGEPVCSPDCPILRRARAGETLLSSDLVFHGYDGAQVPASVAHITPGHEKTAERPYLLIHLLRHTPGPTEQAGKLRIQLLGTTRVWQPNGTSVTGGAWKQKKVRCLLGYLAMQPNQRASRRQIQDALWPELDDERQRIAVDAAVAALRHCLDDTAEWRYLGGSGVYRLTEACWIDAAAFDERIHLARLELDIGRAIGLYQEALALYGGYYVADLDATEPWCLRERVRLHNLYLNAMEELGLVYESIGLSQSALMMYYRLLEVEPEHTGARRRLFRLAEDSSGALSVIRTCTWLSRRLTSELDRLATFPAPLNHDWA
jgi:DNA-binding SARP family transcriptional activator